MLMLATSWSAAYEYFCLFFSANYYSLIRKLFITCRIVDSLHIHAHTQPDLFIWKHKKIKMIIFNRFSTTALIKLAWCDEDCKEFCKFEVHLLLLVSTQLISLPSPGRWNIRNVYFCIWTHTLFSVLAGPAVLVSFISFSLIKTCSKNLRRRRMN